VLGNLNTMLAGATHSLKYRKDGENYLGTSAYRFNRRFDRCDLIAQVIINTARRVPIKKAVVRTHAQAHFQSDLIY
jgi:hypothetical protein